MGPMSAASSLSRESRWLRLGGMALMLIAMSTIAILAETAHPLQLLRTGDRSQHTSLALVFFVLANLFALGLVFLLVGLKQLSLLRNAHARRGALVRMAAANLMGLVECGNPPE